MFLGHPMTTRVCETVFGAARRIPWLSTIPKSSKRAVILCLFFDDNKIILTKTRKKSLTGSNTRIIRWWREKICAQNYNNRANAMCRREQCGGREWENGEILVNALSIDENRAWTQQYKRVKCVGETVWVVVCGRRRWGGGVVGIELTRCWRRTAAGTRCIRRLLAPYSRKRAL